MEALGWLTFEADRPELILATAYHSRVHTRNAELAEAGVSGTVEDAGHTTAQLEALLQYGAELGLFHPMAQAPPASPSGTWAGTLTRPADQVAHPTVPHQHYMRDQGAVRPQTTLTQPSATPTMAHHGGIAPATPCSAPGAFPTQPPPGASPFGTPGTHLSPFPTLPPGGWR